MRGTQGRVLSRSGEIACPRPVTEIPIALSCGGVTVFSAISISKEAIPNFASATHDGNAVPQRKIFCQSGVNFVGVRRPGFPSSSSGEVARPRPRGGNDRRVRRWTSYIQGNKGDFLVCHPRWEYHSISYDSRARTLFGLWRLLRMPPRDNHPIECIVTLNSESMACCDGPTIADRIKEFETSRRIPTEGKRR